MKADIWQTRNVDSLENMPSDRIVYSLEKYIKNISIIKLRRGSKANVTITNDVNSITLFAIF